jgi:hypothetical protein
MKPPRTGLEAREVIPMTQRTEALQGVGTEEMEWVAAQEEVSCD